MALRKHEKLVGRVAIGVLLGIGAVGPSQAQFVTWDGSCGSSDWHHCCGGGGSFDNNWDVGSGPSCPALPGPNDDVDLGGGTVRLFQSPEEINSLMSQGVFTIAGVDLVVTQGAILSEFHLGGGGLHAGGIVDIAGPFDWRGGQIAHLGGPPVQTFLRGGLTLDGGILNGRQTISTAGSTWTGGDFSLNQGSSFDNQDTFTIACDKIIRGTDGVFINSGMLGKMNSPGETRILAGVAFRNTATGMLDIQTGTIRLEGGGENSGQISLAQGTTLRLKSRTFTFLENTNVQGPGLLWAEGGTVQAAGIAMVTMENLRVSGGSLRGPGFWSPATMVWEGGTLDGVGFTSAATLNIGAAATKTLSNHMLTATGSALWSGAGPLRLLNGASFSLASGRTMIVLNEPKNLVVSNGSRWTNEPESTLDLLTDINFGAGGSGGTLTNQQDATINFGPGASSYEFAFNVRFEHFGIANVNSGTLLVRPGQSRSATFHVAAGAVLNFKSRIFEVESTQFTGDGLVKINAGTVDFQPGMYSMNNLELSRGAITGAGDVSITNQFNWEGGQMTGSGSTVSTNVMNIFSAGNLTITQRTLKNDRQANWLGADIVLNEGAKFHNAAGAILDIAPGGEFAHTIGADGVVENDGILRQLTGGNMLRFPRGVQFNHNGTANLQSGNIRIAGGGTSTGQFAIAAGLTVDFASDPYLLDAGTSFVGVGAARLVSGTLTVNGEDVEAQTFKMEGGVLDGPGRLKITGTFDWTGGGMQGPSIGRTRSIGTMNISGSSGKSVSERTLLNEGTANWTGSGLIVLNGGAKLINETRATFNDRTSSFAVFLGEDSGTFINNGTYVRSGSVGDTTFADGVAFDNNGTLNIEGEQQILIRGGGTSTGTFNLGVFESALIFAAGPYSLNTGTITAGAGKTIVEAAAVTVNGEVHINNHNFELRSAGAVGGPGNLIVTDRFQWRGTMNGPGTTTTRGFSAIREGAVLDRRTLENEGTMSLLGDLEVRNNAVINNRGVFRVEQLPAGNKTITGDGSVAFNNFGTFKNQVNPDESGTIDLVFLNQARGTVINESGTLRFKDAYGQTASATLIARGGLIIFDHPPTISNGSRVEGRDRIIVLGQVRSSGTFGPGASAGTLTLEGDYLQEPDGTLEIELGGLVPGTEHDVFVVTGAASLAGRLEVHLINGFVPQIDDSFEVLQAGSISGTFDEIALFGFPASLRVDVTYNADSVVLQVNSRLAHTPSSGNAVNPLSIQRIPQP